MILPSTTLSQDVWGVHRGPEAAMWEAPRLMSIPKRRFLR